MKTLHQLLASGDIETNRFMENENIEYNIYCKILILKFHEIIYFKYNNFV